MKMHKLFFLTMCMLLITGCSQKQSEEMPDIDSLRQSTESMSETESAVPENIFYLTDHGTQSPETLTKFRKQLETDGFLWNECKISAIPEDANMLIYNAPQEDLTPEEYQILEQYAETGGDILVLLPASESETRFKFLNNFLEMFSIQIDYDKITESDNFRIQEDNSIRLNMITVPMRFIAYEEKMQDSPVYMRNMRSFHLLGDYATDELYVDVILQTEDTATGEPFGGVEDDPLTYEMQKLDIMVYSQDTTKNNACLIACGAGDFLTDENFEAKTSVIAREWIYSALQWFVNNRL